MQTTTYNVTNTAPPEQTQSDGDTLLRIEQLFDRIFCDDGDCIELEQICGRTTAAS